ncbi:hypothetical protein C162_05189 [Paenibacillus sp. FSL R7-269]|nr:hypothetical protein C162_05189 [Paenibacillus sp. FSL R7-269]
MLMLIYLDINVKVVVILARGMTRQWHHTVIQVLTIQHVLIGGGLLPKFLLVKLHHLMDIVLMSSMLGLQVILN